MTQRQWWKTNGVFSNLLLVSCTSIVYMLQTVYEISPYAHVLLFQCDPAMGTYVSYRYLVLTQFLHFVVLQ